MGKLGMAIGARLPPAERASVASWTITLLVLSLLILIVGTHVINAVFDDGFDGLGLVAAGVLRTALWGPIVFFLVLKHHQLKFANARLQVAASTDFLTGCLNRQAFSAAVERHLTGSAGFGRRHALLVIDADGFKRINDRFGHDQGDEALRLIAGAIDGSVRSVDIVGRLGGEEFGALLVGADAAAAADVAERIRAAVAGTSFAPAGHSQRLSVSIGGAVSDQPTDFADLNRRADQLMYRAKRFGRDRAALEPPPGAELAPVVPLTAVGR